MTKSDRKKNIDKFSITSLKGDVLTLEADEAHPPGYRMVLTVETPQTPIPVRITGKVIAVDNAGAKKNISLRIHSLKRSERELVLEKIAQRDSSSNIRLDPH